MVAIRGCLPMAVMLMDYILVRPCTLQSGYMQTKLHSIAILDMLHSSDHVPLSFVLDFNSSPTLNDTFTCPSNKTNFNWAIATDKDLTDYKYLWLLSNMLIINNTNY